MTDSEIRKVLEKFATVARPIILKEFPSRDNCIVSTAVTIGVLKNFGIKAVPLPVDVTVMNPDKASPVAIKPEAAVGHLVAIIEQKYLIDVSIDQLNRPEKNILLPGVIFGNVEHTLVKSFGARFSVAGCAVVYDPAPERILWQGSPDWYNQNLYAAVIAKIIAAINKHAPER